MGGASTSKIMRPELQRLEDLARSVAYQQIITWLKEIQNLKPITDEEGSVPSSDEVVTFFSPLQENAITMIRSYLDQHLVGIVGDKTRSIYVQNMYAKFREFQNFQGSKKLLEDYTRFRQESPKVAMEKMRKKFNKKTTIDVPLFLACVLDEGIEELKIPVTFLHMDMNPKVMAIVAERAPNLKILKMNLSRIKRGTSYDDTIPLITALSPLANLTNLSLYYLVDDNRLILQSLGKSCPSLSYLKVSRHGFLLEDMDVKGIVLGELAGEVDLYEEEDYFLQVPSDCLPPMSFSLRHLHLANVAWEDYSDRYFKRYYHPVVFALRHLPNLEKLDGVSTCMAIKVLYDTYQGKQRKKTQKKFEAQCRSAVSHLNKQEKKKDENLPIQSNPTFSGTLSLVRIDVLPARDAEILRIIGSVCPNLKEVRFWDYLPMCRLDYCFGDTESESDEDAPKKKKKEESSPTEVESSLREWPQLENIAMVGVTWEYAQAILKVFGPKLKKLTIERCKNFNLLKLMPCNQLETLRILSETGLEPIPENHTTSIADGFLPKLSNLESKMCLGSNWTRIFERKSNLTSVSLYCCHVGTQGSSCSDWKSFTMMWPALEHLRILACDGMNWSTLSDIVHRLGGIKEISIPERARCRKMKLMPRVLDDLRNRPTPINLRFIDDVYKCPYLEHLPDMEFASESEGSTVDEGGEVEMIEGDVDHGEEEDGSSEEEDCDMDEEEEELADGEIDDDEKEEVAGGDGTEEVDEEVEDEEEEKLNRRFTYSDSDSDESF